MLLEGGTVGGGRGVGGIELHEGVVKANQCLLLEGRAQTGGEQGKLSTRWWGFVKASQEDTEPEKREGWTDAELFAED